MTSTAGLQGPSFRFPDPLPSWHRWAWLCGLACAMLLGWLAPARAQDDPPGRVGRVALVEGEARWRDPQSGQWVPVERNQPVTGGDRVQVPAGSRAQLEVGSSTWLLDGGSELEVLRLDDAAMRIELHGGSLGLVLRSDDAVRETEVVTIAGRFLPQLRGRYRIDDTGDAAVATAWTGRLRFEAGGSGRAVTLVDAGQRAEFWLDGGMRANGAPPTSDAFAEWVAAVDRPLPAGPTARYVSPEMTGYQDLDQHGRWETSVEYGPVWTPTVVETGWAPYRDGRWTWVAPWGWTWVDRAPWGYAPFHYGRWVRWRDRWCWTPGGYVSRPVWAPALVGWVGSPGLSVNLTIGAPPPLGWVPLAPREIYRPWYPVGWQHWRAVNEYRHDRDDDWREWRRHPRTGGPGDWARDHGHYVNGRLPGAVTLAPVGVDWRRRDPLRPVVLPGLGDDRRGRDLSDRRDDDRRGDDRNDGRDDRGRREPIVGRDDDHRLGARPGDDGRLLPMPGVIREPDRGNGRDGREGRDADNGRTPRGDRGDRNVDGGRNDRNDREERTPRRVMIDDGPSIGRGESGRAERGRDRGTRDNEVRPQPRPVPTPAAPRIDNSPRDASPPRSQPNPPRTDPRPGRDHSAWRDDGPVRAVTGAPPRHDTRPREPSPSRTDVWARQGDGGSRHGNVAPRPSTGFAQPRHEQHRVDRGGGSARGADPRIVGRQPSHDRYGSDRR